jgi:forespore regulator of the sigma-K checkpoint
MRMKLTVPIRYVAAVMTIFLIMLINRDLGMVGATTDIDTSPFLQKTERTVILERVYLDGEISEELVHEPVQSQQDLCAKYSQWQLVDINKSNVLFRKNVNDISPLLKANGFFGVTREGVLSIFNGKPGQAKIIQSFFQIDIKKLESKKQEELFHGIPVRTKNRYVEVLETFKPYSTNQKQRN